MENKKWFIPGSVPSSKNGKRWTGKYLISSKAVMNYRKIAKIYYAKYAKDFKAELAKHTLPAKISFTFVRGSRHKFDYINPAQTGISNLNNLKYNDRKILNLLFVKSLPYNKRKIFLNNNIFFLCFSSKALIGKNIYNTIEKKGNKKIYKQILLQIMKNQ